MRHASLDGAEPAPGVQPRAEGPEHGQVGGFGEVGPEELLKIGLRVLQCLMLDRAGPSVTSLENWTRCRGCDPPR